MSQQALFNKLKSQGLFWSYSQDLQYEDLPEEVLIEHCLRYAGWDELQLLFKVFEKEHLFSIWQANIMPDQRFLKQNLFIARVLFKLPFEAEDLQRQSYARNKKLRILAS